MGKSLRCLLRWHHYWAVRNPEGGRYLVCTMCGHENDVEAEIRAAGG